MAKTEITVDDVKRNIHDHYIEEYTQRSAKDPVSPLLTFGVAAFGLGMLGLLGGVGLLMVGVALGSSAVGTAALISLGGSFVATLAGCFSAILSKDDDNAINALEADIKNGTLLDHYEREVLPKKAYGHEEKLAIAQLRLSASFGAAVKPVIEQDNAAALVPPAPVVAKIVL